jgi:uncharacterized protein with HEPN domain
MSNRDNLLLIEDMLQSALKIKDYTKNFDYQKFINDSKTIDAVIRKFEIIGEGANRIDEDFRFKTPKIEWNRIKGFRNRIVHEYFGIDYQIVWDIIENYLEDLILRLKEQIEKN